MFTFSFRKKAQYLECCFNREAILYYFVAFLTTENVCTWLCGCNGEPCLGSQTIKVQKNVFRYQGALTFALSMMSDQRTFDLKKILCLNTTWGITSIYRSIYCWCWFALTSRQIIHIAIVDSMCTFPILSISHHKSAPPKESQGQYQYCDLMVRSFLLMWADVMLKVESWRFTFCLRGFDVVFRHPGISLSSN